VSPQGYLSVLFAGTFFSALLFYLHADLAAILLFAGSWIVLPYLALNDHIILDAKGLYRTGLLPRWWMLLSGSRRRVKLPDVEQIETEIVRIVKRGNDLSYRYRTSVRSRQVSLTFYSGGEDYRRLMKAILSRVPEGSLDYRSLELRDSLEDPKETLMRAEFSRIPSADMLAGLLFDKPRRKLRDQPADVDAEAESDPTELVSLGRDLKVAGYLLQSLEAFRRALVIKPHDARLLFDFAQCLYAVAGVRRDRSLERRAKAAVRLSARRGANDSDLLLRVGEWHFQAGEFRRAREIFEFVTDRFGESFVALRGLAELALRDGKIARVVHYFAAAARAGEAPSLTRWSNTEAEYFANLNSDETYMDMELSRINMADTVAASRRNVLRLVLLSMPLIPVGIVLEDEFAANLGWAISSLSILVWIGLSFAGRLFARRISYEMVGEE
jgi:tetratricopeptide (TPR) repeat protein